MAEMVEFEPGHIVRIMNESSGQFVIVDISEDQAILRKTEDGKGEELESYPLEQLVIEGHI